ncbi:hypothetical protein GCM10029976_051210 [Kribbella albertanoniae]|uniref:DUF1992 domain-containing protein n=1 Tax=Kribbella albertanoniae TaxID=1266829 RepID=A0A4R4PLW7_9ACTN|nr:DUF1992 domain-containing protein [Kribbella albertanoniae]TDC23008.1 DUF1992 domain-containing protein [Kribbella albertanoniae]
MTSRKPPSMSMQEWIDHQLREAEKAGEFDNLVGAGKPLKLADKHDPDWWVKDFIRRENLDTEALLPVPVLLRKEKARVREKVAKMRRESEVRDYLEDLNKRIVLAIRDATGPVIPVGKVDAEAALKQWRVDHEEWLENRRRAVTRAAEETAVPEKKSFWQRIFS